MMDIHDGGTIVLEDVRFSIFYHILRLISIIPVFPETSPTEVFADDRSTCASLLQEQIRSGDGSH
jgi:hypothetical protein